MLDGYATYARRHTENFCNNPLFPEKSSQAQLSSSNPFVSCLHTTAINIRDMKVQNGDNHTQMLLLWNIHSFLHCAEGFSKFLFHGL